MQLWDHQTRGLAEVDSGDRVRKQRVLWKFG